MMSSIPPKRVNARFIRKRVESPDPDTRYDASRCFVDDLSSQLKDPLGSMLSFSSKKKFNRWTAPKGA